jgi:hypothetical protein
VNGVARRAALVAAVGMAAFYGIVVGWAGGVEHLTDQARRDWWLVVPITLAFGAQVGVMVELRERHARHHALTPAAGAASGTYAAGMVACCAHHLVELAPIAGLTGFATTLSDARIPLMVAGLVVNLAVLAFAVRRLRHTPSARGAVACAA